jgi:hypothetical protein
MSIVKRQKLQSFMWALAAFTSSNLITLVSNLMWTVDCFTNHKIFSRMENRGMPSTGKICELLFLSLSNKSIICRKLGLHVFLGVFLSLDHRPVVHRNLPTKMLKQTNYATKWTVMYVFCCRQFSGH